MIRRVRLPRTGEPKWYKDAYRRDKARSGDLARAALKQGTWFVKPYWDLYKQLLKDMGVTWQMLMEAWGYSKHVLRAVGRGRAIVGGGLHQIRRSTK